MLKNTLPSTAAAKWMTLGVSLASLGLVWMAGAPAQANVALTRADIEAILNRVELIPRGRSARMARQSDLMAVGDTLRTAAQAQAQLRFNDGSLARVGERATFQFLPNTRNFRLSNGTMLLLIPPGRGRSTIQTPSAITGIQGSAVVVRHIEDRNLTIVMALTNNPAGPMTVTTQGCSGADAADACVAEHALYAGQMAIVQNNQVQILEFDLPTFYDTNSLTDGLELNNPDSAASLGPALDQVRAETLEALSRESAFADTTVLNPAALAIDPSGQSSANEPWLLSPAIAETQVGGRMRQVLPVSGSLVGVPLLPIPRQSTSGETIPQAPVENTPLARPTEPAPAPTVQPPVAQPPVAQPPTPRPPVAQPPVVQPPTPQPPVAQPPVAQPGIQPPVIVQPPAVTPPVVDPPVVPPPVVPPPVVDPPVVPPPVVDPPVVPPPVVDPPVVDPPVVPPPRPVVPANPPPFREDPEFPATPPAEPPVIFQPDA